MQTIDIDALAKELPRLRAEWQDTRRGGGVAVAVTDTFLTADARDDVFDSVPEITWPEWDNVGDTLQAAKWSCERIERFPPPIATLLHELNSAPMLRLLEDFTGIAGLLPDPHLWGGGLHVTRPGGYLWPHTDFPSDQRLGLKRVLNLLCYVHRHWTPESGGHFQLWRDGVVARSIVPLPGRCVVFRTDATSVHGVSRVEGGDDRRSVAVFYYTLPYSANHPADTTTGWRLQTVPSGASVPTVRRTVANGFMRLSATLRAASIAMNERAEHIMNARTPPSRTGS